MQIHSIIHNYATAPTTPIIVLIILKKIKFMILFILKAIRIRNWIQKILHCKILGK